jgi:hypothetical protein
VDTMKCTWVYVWALPLIWCTLSFWSFQFPGDEYGIWVIGSLPAVLVWIWIKGNTGDIHGFVVPVLLIGACLMAVIGLLMDWLRVAKPLSGGLFLAVGIIIAVLLLSIEPGRPIWTSRNQIPSYGLFALIMGLYLGILVSTIGTTVVRIYGWTRKQKGTAPAATGEHG